MPNVITENGFRLFFYSNERNEPPHVHVDYQGAHAKFWIGPVYLAWNLGMNAGALSKAEDLVIKHEKLTEEKWNEFFGKKN
ncbi:DUF4160 domain-containing protein [Bdellovibrionota bacterium FG-1]